MKSLTTLSTLSTFAAIAMLASACGSGIDDPAGLDTPRSALPANLAGRWFTGTLTSLQYYDTTNNKWIDRGGSGFYYIFGDDGSYETGAVIDSTVAGCTMRLLGKEIGTVTLEGESMTVYRAWVKTHATNTCGNAGDNEDGPTTATMTWSAEEDEFGEVLVLNNEFGTSRFHRWRD